MLEMLKIELLPTRSSAKHQPLDLRIIAHAHICYQSELLSAVLDVIEKRRTTNEQFTSNSGNRKYGIHEGQLPILQMQ